MLLFFPGHGFNVFFLPEIGFFKESFSQKADLVKKLFTAPSWDSRGRWPGEKQGLTLTLSTYLLVKPTLHPYRELNFAKRSHRSYVSGFSTVLSLSMSLKTNPEGERPSFLIGLRRSEGLASRLWLTSLVFIMA